MLTMRFAAVTILFLCVCPISQVHSFCANLTVCTLSSLLTTTLVAVNANGIHREIAEQRIARFEAPCELMSVSDGCISADVMGALFDLVKHIPRNREGKDVVKHPSLKPPAGAS